MNIMVYGNSCKTYDIYKLINQHTPCMCSRSEHVPFFTQIGYGKCKYLEIIMLRKVQLAVKLCTVNSIVIYILYYYYYYYNGAGSHLVFLALRWNCCCSTYRTCSSPHRSCDVM